MLRAEYRDRFEAIRREAPDDRVTSPAAAHGLVAHELIEITRPGTVDAGVVSFVNANYSHYTDRMNPADTFKHGDASLLARPVHAAAAR